MAKKHRITYTVEEIRGNCPVYKVGDKAVFDSFPPAEVVNLKESTAVCLRMIDNFVFHLAYQHGGDELNLYLGGGVGEVRLACAMPGPPYTPCGYCIFRFLREDLE